MAQRIRFTLNGKPVQVETEGDRMLLWVLRTDLELTGTKYGCGMGLCGACTVLVDGEPQRSCVLPVQAVAGKSVTTIEGLADGEKLHPLQEAFVEEGALQCGFCTPGIILADAALLRRNPDPTDVQIKQALEGHLCRCSAYHRIVPAVQAAARRMRG
jgi:aerobic-type carbon monoxide dehydrogenase small subunit (CoxS/CutS family)